jgi:hypothetical protein
MTINIIFFCQSESDIFVEWSDGEKSEYDALEKQARDFFNQLSRKVGSKLSSHYLKLQRGLTAIRIACSGGHVPLPDEGSDPPTKKDTKTNEAGEGNDTEVDHAEGDDSDRDDKKADEEDSAGKKPRGKKIVRYSDFCYTSKMEKLIEELVRIRDEDPSGTMILDRPGSTVPPWLSHAFIFFGVFFNQPKA